MTTLVALLLSGGGFFLPILKPFQESFFSYVGMIWWALALGFLVAGIINRYVPAEYISKFLAQPKKRTIIYAAFLGLVMSACSHGILAIAIQLHKKGASGPAVISFLLGSPWANLPVTLLLVSLFKIKGLVIIVSAIFVALTTGWIFMGLSRLEWVESNPNTVDIDESFSIRNDIKKRWKKWTRTEGSTSLLQMMIHDTKVILQGSWQLANMILWWIMLGIILASLIGAYVPSNIFTHYLGPTFTGLLLTLGAATVIEICSEGSAPMAFEIYRHTGSLGNAFAFLMGGFVTDYTEVGLIWQNLGRRTALWMVGITVPQVILIGWLCNQF